MEELSEKEREARAKANIEASQEAQRLAAEARAREGNQPPVAQVVANSILEKLKHLPQEAPAE